MNHSNDSHTLLIWLLKLNRPIKNFEKVKYMSFIPEEKKIKQININEIRNKIKDPVGKDFDTEPINNEKYI